MNRPILVRSPGRRPRGRCGAAADGEDPVAGAGAQQDPGGHRDEDDPAESVILKVTPPMVNCEAKTFCAELKPCMLAMSWVATGC